MDTRKLVELNQHMAELVPILSLIDTLHLGFGLKNFKLTDEDWRRLEEAKQMARSGNIYSDKNLVEFEGKQFNNITSAKRYAYVLFNDDITVKIARKISNGAYPEIFVEFRSRFLMGGITDAYRIVREWIDTWAEIDYEKVSRADIAQDYQGIVDVDIEKTVMRCRNNSEHYEPFSKHRSGRKLTGYTFGKDDLVLRIYDKTTEIEKSCKGYMKDEWRKQGWDGLTSVWRVEAQIRRKVIKEFKVETVEDLTRQAADLWKYITGEWFTVREPSKTDRTRSRWKFTSQWEVIHKSFIKLGQLTGVVREKIKNATIDKMIPQIAGLMTSVAALMLKERIPLAEIYGKVIEHCGRKKSDVGEIIREKKRRYCLFEETLIYGAE